MIKHANRLLLILLLTACTTTTDQWPQIQTSGTLRIGLDPNYPPFETLTDNGYHGLDIDLAHALAAELGLTAQFVPISYDGLYDALLTDQVDVLISALVIFPERTRDVAYSTPYFDAGQRLILPQNSPINRDPSTAVFDPSTTDFDPTTADFDPSTIHTIAVELATQGHVLATHWQRTNPALVIQTYNTPEELLAAVAAPPPEAPPAAITDAITAYLALPQYPTLTLHPTPLQPDPYVLVTRRDDSQLLDHLNQALATLHHNGTLTTLRQQHGLTHP